MALVGLSVFWAGNRSKYGYPFLPVVFWVFSVCLCGRVKGRLTSRVSLSLVSGFPLREPSARLGRVRFR